MGLNASNPRTNFAYDIHKDVISKGEAKDEEAIAVSIENILSTYFGERLFNPYFGSVLPAQLFESLNEDNSQQLLDSIIEAIEIWEKRITIIKSKVHLTLVLDDNSMELSIPYVVNGSNIESKFDKRIIL